MLSGGSRITQHIRECNYHHNQLGLGFGLGLGFCSSAKRLDLSSSFVVRPPSVSVSDSNRSSYHHARSSIFPDFSLPLAGCIQPRSPSGQSPVLSDCFSQQEDDDNAPPEGSTSVAGGIVALGKFDALHIGHRELAIQAAKAGIPFLLSFVGMAEVLGWEPRAPIVAKCDRKRVLSSWAPYCGNLTPAEYEVQFSKVRQLTPRQFVEKLSKELGVSGVVAGENYRFGYRAAGTALDLVKLCNEYGMEAYIINSVMDRNQNPRIIGSGNSKEKGQVSSTRVRHALAKGEMKYVSELLGRQHRLVLAVKGQEWSLRSQRIVSARTSCLLNLAPKDGLYESCSLFSGGRNGVPCRVSIDANDVCLEVDDVTTCQRIVSGEYRCLAIDFGEC